MEVVCGEESRWGLWLVVVVVGGCVGGEGGFVGREEGGEGGDGGVFEMGARWWLAGEGIPKMVGEGGDEGCVEIVAGEVLLVIPEEDRGDGGEVVVALGEGVDGNVSREFGWVTKGQSETIAGVEEGSVGVVEGEESRANLAERRWGGGESGAKGGEIGCGGGVGCAEETLVLCRGEDVLVPEEGEVVVGEGWGR